MGQNYIKNVYYSNYFWCFIDVLLFQSKIVVSVNKFAVLGDRIVILGILFCLILKVIIPKIA